MKIKLNNRFYKKEAIEETIKEFKDVCECKIIDDSFEIEAISNEISAQKIKDEFCNFVLGLTKDKMQF